MPFRDFTPGLTDGRARQRPAVWLLCLRPALEFFQHPAGVLSAVCQDALALGDVSTRSRVRPTRSSSP